MYSKSRVVFIGEGKKGIESLHETLSLICCFPCMLEEYLEHKIIVVNNDLDYKTALIVGNMFAFNNSYDVKWVSKYGLAMPINEFCICRITLKCFNEHASAEVEYFVSSMAKSINIPVNFKLNEIKQYEIYINFSDIFSDIRGCSVDYNYIVTIAGLKLDYVKSFIDSYLNERDYKECFDSIDVIDFSGNIVLTKTQNEIKKLEKLHKYFIESSLCTGLVSPNGNNIAAKITCSDIDLFDNGDYYLCDYSYNLNSFETNIDNKKAIINAYLNSLYEIIPNDIKVDKKSNNRVVVTTKCKCFYEEYYNRNIDKVVVVPIPSKFIVEDSLEIVTFINIVSNKKLVVTSNVNVKRHVINKRKCNAITIIDKLFGRFDYDENEFSFTYKDYYEIIDMNLLLHYTDRSAYYETYQIPIWFKFEDGLDSVMSTRIIYAQSNPERIVYDNISKVIEHLRNSNILKN